MDKMLKIALIAGGAYALYVYLQKAGLIAGSTSTFTDTPSLLNYCAANPTASASFNSGGAVASFTCAQWAAANKPASSTPATTSTPGNTVTSTVGQVTPLVVQQMIDATGLQSSGFDGWSWAYQNVTGKTITPDQFSAIVSAGGGNRSQQITAQQFYALLNSTTGMSGLPRHLFPPRVVAMSRRIQ